ncbi:MAG: sigma-70 family RNA polymerase sigma factor [Lysinibacillus sp.]
MDIQQCVKAVQAGDKSAFRTIVVTYEQKVFTTASRMTGNQSLAEDLVQDGFIKAFKNIAKSEPTGSFNAWLYRLAMHHCLDYLKKKRPEVAQDETFITDNTYPEQQLLHKEKDHQLHALLYELEDTERLVLLLRYVNELRYDEIAEILHISHTEVRNKLHRSKKKLRTSGTAKGGYFYEMR